MIVIFIVTFITFMFLHMIPGDPVIYMLGTHATQEQIEALTKELQLDRHFIIQYGYWLSNTLQGDFGKSIVYGDYAFDLIAKRLPATIYIGIFSLIIAVVFGIAAGIISAVTRGSILDQIITLLANIGVAVPTFWLGIMGIYLFGLKLGWLPTWGYTSPFDDFWLSIRQLIMPAITLAVIPLAMMTRQTRSSMLEVLHQDYIRTARAKGLVERLVITRHALINALILIITLIGLQIASLLSGSVLVETVFNIPGMGRLLVNAVLSRDFIVVQACVFIIAVFVAVVNLATDISYGLLDPRIRQTMSYER
jgi:peptide/nickel transport system permease protein